MRIKHKVWFSLNEYPINSRKLHRKFQTKSEMESINIIISAAKADWGWSANNLALQVFAYHTLKAENKCPCCLPSYLPFFCWHPVQKMPVNHLSIMQGRHWCAKGVPFKDEIRQGFVYGTPCRQNIQMAYFRRLGFCLSDARHHQKAHSFPLEEFSNVHDSIRDEFMRIATAKRRTFKDVLVEDERHTL